MKRFSIVFALVIAACGGDAKTTPNKIEVAVPHDAAVEINTRSGVNLLLKNH